MTAHGYSAGLHEFVERNHYLAGANVEGIGAMFVVQTITGAQIGRAEGMEAGDGVRDRWSYVELRDAFTAWQDWVRRGFEGEPSGWVRHQPTNRRRRYHEADESWPLNVVQEWIAP